jgi:outer membrane protein
LLSQFGFSISKGEPAHEAKNPLDIQFQSLKPQKKSSRPRLMPELNVETMAATTENKLPKANLIEIYNMALGQDSKISSASHLLEAARLKFESDQNKIHGLNANFSAGVNFNNRSISPVNNLSVYGWTEQVGLNLSMPLFNQTLDLQAEQSQINIASEEVNNEITYQSFIMEIVASYFEVLRAEENIRLKEEVVREATNYLKKIKLGEEVGTEKYSAVADAQALINGFTAEKIVLMQSLKNSKIHIDREWLIKNLNLAKLNSKLPLSKPVLGELETWIIAAETSNLSVRKAQIAIQSADKAIAVADSKFTPQVYLSSNVGFQNTTFSSYGELQQSDSGIGISVSVPLYDGGSTPSLRKSLVAAKFSSQDLQLESVKRAGEKAAIAYSNIEMIFEALKIRERELSARERSYDALRIENDYGMTNSFEVVTALRALNDAKMILNSTRFELIYEQLKLKEAVGLVSFDDIVYLNQLLAK